MRSPAGRPAALTLFYWLVFVETRPRKRVGFAFLLWSRSVTQLINGEEKDDTEVKTHTHAVGLNTQAAGVSGVSV